MKWIFLIIIAVAVYFNFRTEEARTNFFAKFKSAETLIASNKETAYQRVEALAKDKKVLGVKPSIQAIEIDESWWTSLDKNQKKYHALLFAVYMASETKSTTFDLKIMNSNSSQQLGSYRNFEGYKDYDQFDFGKLSK